MRQNRAFVLLAVAAALTPVSVSTVNSAELLRRAWSLEELVGRVELRSAFGTRLRVLVKCESDPRGCVEEQVYDEVVRSDFLRLRREIRGDTFIEIEDPIGTIYLAIDFRGQDREVFWAKLRDLISRLSAEAFVRPFAGWGPMQRPFDKETMSATGLLPSWVCFESDARTTVLRFHRPATDRPNDPEVQGLGAQQYEEPPTTACEEMEVVTADAYPDVFQTMASPSRLLELVVEHEDLVLVDTDYPGSLANRPVGVRLVKQRAYPGASAETTSDVVDGGTSFATHIAGGWRFDARTEPAQMPIAALDQNAWLHSWTVTEVERELGLDPSDQVIASSSLFAAFLALVPATVVPEGSFFAPEDALPDATDEVVAETPARIDRSRFLSRFSEELDRHGGAPLELIEGLVSRPPVGLRSEGWLVVLCRDDGSATYYLPPTKAFHRVTNADAFCGALEVRLR